MEGSSDPLYGLVVYPLWIFLAKAEGLYDADHPKIWHRTTDEATALFHWATLSAAATLLPPRAPGRDHHRGGRGHLWFTALVGAFIYRAVARAAWRTLVTPSAHS